MHVFDVNQEEASHFFQTDHKMWLALAKPGTIISSVFSMSSASK
jgi:hypothetical protein